MFAAYNGTMRTDWAFCHGENGRDVCGTFNFVHVWRRTTDGWQITRAVSYDH